ncbi:hypothetical protein ACQP2P_20185 [Dactylosporangium sp. CA-139114]|uniref:hypothetical protein n=1 Tax=Dactylosporangium sp. CA-139114 TaxID=3239931 RepID=UPI003D97610F
MSIPVELAIPARQITVQVTLGRAGEATTLEDLVARALLLGYKTVREQSRLFAVPQRIIVDVIGTLWGKGYVTVDFDSSTVELSDTARDLLAKHKRLIGAEQRVETRKFIFEPITGLILPDRLADVRPSERSVQLPLRHGVTVADLPPAELVRAVQAAIRSDTRLGSRTTVLGVNFGNPMMRPVSAVRWLHLTATTKRDTRSDRFVIDVQLAKWGTGAAWQRLSDYVVDLADREPDHPAVRRLHSQAELTVEAPERVDRLLHRMAETINDLPDVELAQVAERQRTLQRLARRVEEQLAAAKGARAAITVINRAEAYEWAVPDLIQQARRQIVIATPTIDYSRLAVVLPALREALGRGVWLVVLWGSGDTDSLPDRVRAALDELQLLHGKRVLVARRSARTEACLIVQDDQRALVGSHGPLSAIPPVEREASVLIEPGSAGPNPPSAVIDLLLWARSAFPHYQVGRLIKADAQDFEHDDIADTGGPAVLDVPLPSFDRDDVDAAVVKILQSSWAEHHTALVQAYQTQAGPDAVVEIVRDGQHRTQLWYGLRAARRRLVVTDDRIDTHALEGDIATALRDRMAAGAVVLVAHPQIRSAPTRPAPGRTAPPKKIPVLLERQCGRLVIADAEVLVGSFSPLSDAQASARRGQRSQVGVHIRSEEVAQEIAAAVGAAHAAAAPAPAAMTPAVAAQPGQVDQVALPILLEARLAGSRELFGRRVAERLRGVADPWHGVEVWLDADVPRHEIRAAVSALLGVPAVAEMGQARGWARWLVTDAWQRRSFVEAALLARLLQDRLGALASAATLAAAIEAGPLGAAAGAAALVVDDHPGPAQLAAAAGALAERMLWGGAEGKGALEVLAPNLPAAWRELAEVAVHTEGIPPLDALAAEQLRATNIVDLQARRLRLVADIDKIERLRGRFDFETGVALHDALFAPEGLLTRIRDAARLERPERDAVSPGLPLDVRKYLNDLILRAGVPAMQWHRQNSFVRRLEELVRSARVVADAPVVELEDAEGVQAMHGFRSFADRLADGWDRLFSEASAAPDGYDQPPLAMLDRLAPLRWWARGRR